MVMARLVTGGPLACTLEMWQRKSGGLGSSASRYEGAEIRPFRNQAVSKSGGFREPIHRLTPPKDLRRSAAVKGLTSPKGLRPQRGYSGTLCARRHPLALALRCGRGYQRQRLAPTHVSRKVSMPRLTVRVEQPAESATSVKDAPVAVGQVLNGIPGIRHADTLARAPATRMMVLPSRAAMPISAARTPSRLALVPSMPPLERLPW